jgi:hypothetical protein
MAFHGISVSGSTSWDNLCRHWQEVLLFHALSEIFEKQI